MSLTLDVLFQQAGFTPNDKQRQAIEHTSGPLFLVAGPGSGKTRVLLWRTVNLLVFHGVRPEEIFLATFTEKAAKQLKDGLLSLLGLVTNLTGQTYDLSPMYVGTLHALCNRLLTDRALAAGRTRQRAPRVMDELDQFFHLHGRAFWRSAQAALNLPAELEECYGNISEHFTGKRSPSRYKTVTNLTGLFNRFSEENLTPEDLIARAPDAQMRQLADLYRHYLTSLNGRVDLSLLQQAAFHLLRENPGTRQVFRHVIVDEYQDTNAIQERLYFHLAGNTNICVVGDDDQALYRFRGATVENFVQFPGRCAQYLGCEPRRIELATNYRSRGDIVNFYTRFIDEVEWRRADGGHYRLHDKGIHAHSEDEQVAVVATRQASSDDVAEETARFVKTLLDTGKVADPNQIAFLFPSLKSKMVEKMQRELEKQGLRVYAPRARRFLEAEEPTAVLGLLALLFGKPDRNTEFRGEYGDFHDWLDFAAQEARTLVKNDEVLARFLADRRDEIGVIRQDYLILSRVLEEHGWKGTDVYDPRVQKRALYSAAGLSDRGRKALGAAYLDRLALKGLEENDPFTLRYVVNRATSLEWNILDLFYRLCGFQHLKAMFDLAERGEDEGPVCNLSLLSQQLARFIDQYPSIISAEFLEDNRFQNTFFGSFMYALFRLGEGEYEDANDPFPKGRVPFLTVHQSKGLEFPVVVLGNPSKRDLGPQRVEELVRPYLSGDPEPLDRVSVFDTMRMFYVALSRAKNLLVIAHPRGQGISTHAAFKAMLPEGFPRLADLDLSTVPAAKEEVDDVIRTYSYTSDFLAYQRCPRQYMLFRKYGFAASRTTVMLFGSLVHETIEDLHNHLIARRQEVMA